MPAVEARRRDAAGEPYSVLAFAGWRPVAVVDHHGIYHAVWLFDDDGRRYLKADFRQLEPGRVLLYSLRRWVGADESAEPDEWLSVDVARRIVIRVVRLPGVTRHGTGAIDIERLWQPAAVFGDAATLAPPLALEILQGDSFPRWYLPARSLTGSQPMISNEALATPADPQALAAILDEIPSSPLWQAPRPLQPADFAGWFVDGRRFAIGGHAATIRVLSAGKLRLTTGELIAAEPGWNGENTPFTVTVAPGTYPVTVALADWDSGHCGGALAMRLDITDEPPVSWEMALCRGQDPRLLDDEGFFGFAVDGGTAGLLDVEAFPIIQIAPDEDRFQDPLPRLVSDGYAEMTLAGIDANVIGVITAMGDGSYPTWIGRTATGQVACFLVDLEQLRYAVFSPE
jgi:hypothetical protein